MQYSLNLYTYYYHIVYTIIVERLECRDEIR